MIEIKEKSFGEQLNEMSEKEILALRIILTEYQKAKEKYPEWPEDLIYRASIVSEECGELVKAVNETILEGKPYYQIVIEAGHTGAMALRFLSSPIFK